MKESKYYLDIHQRKWLKQMLKNPCGMSDSEYSTVKEVEMGNYYTNSTKTILNKLRTEYLSSKKLGI